MNDTMTGKHPGDSRTELMHVVMPSDLNGAGRLFGGQLARWIDEIAWITARRHAENDAITTASIDNLRFREPVYNNDIVLMIGRVTFTGRTSLEVRVDSYVENTAGVRKLINTAFVTQVSIDKDGKPSPIPPLVPETPQEETEFAAGAKRREIRLSLSDEVYH